MDIRMYHPPYSLAPHWDRTGMAPGRGMNSLRILCRFGIVGDEDTGDSPPVGDGGDRERVKLR